MRRYILARRYVSPPSSDPDHSSPGGSSTPAAFDWVGKCFRGVGGGEVTNRIHLASAAASSPASTLAQPYGRPVTRYPKP